MSEAQKRLVEIEEQEKQLAEEKAKLLAASKDADLALVRKLCRQHGFTATQLRGYLRGKGSGKKAAADGEKQPAAKKAAAKKAPGKAGAKK